MANLKSISGASLIESMISFALVAGGAVALFPIMIATTKSGKFMSGQLECEQLVRSKVDEYRYGRSVGLATEATNSGRDQINLLSVATRSDSSINTDMGGFLYAKTRYNAYFPYACNGTSNVLIYDTQRTLGMRECTGNNSAWEEGGTEPNCNNGFAPTNLPGFKLYVKLELATPWLLATPADADKAAQFNNTCPNFGTNWLDSGTYPEPASAPGALYDFNGAGDAIKVTVTGVIDFKARATDIENFGGIADPNRLTCKATAIIRPPVYPVRYYLTGSSGRIYSVHGLGLNGAEAGPFPFSKLYTQAGEVFSNIGSFAVHPRDLSIWTLRGKSTIVRYGNCGGQPVDCSISATASDGVSDLGTSGWPDVQEFGVPEKLGTIIGIGVDFRSGNVYGLAGDGTTVWRITKSDTTLLRDVSAGSLSPSETTAEVIASTEFPNPLPTDGTTRGFFISAEGDAAFVTKNASSNALGSTSYAASVFRATDVLNPVVTMPVDAAVFSK